MPNVRYPVGGFSPLQGLGDTVQLSPYDLATTPQQLAELQAYQAANPSSMVGSGDSNNFVAPNMIQGAGFLGTSIGGMPAWLLGLGALVVFMMAAPPINYRR